MAQDDLKGVPRPVKEVPSWGYSRRQTETSPGLVIVGKSDHRLQADHERESETRKLLSDYSQTDDEKERAKVIDELTKVVAGQFDIRQEVRERELKELEEQVRKLRELHQRRAKEKEQIIRDRVRQLLRDVDGLGWGGDGDANVPSPLSRDNVRLYQTVPVRTLPNVPVKDTNPLDAKK